MIQTDYLIVGQGLAGTVLSFTLLQQGKRVAVVDNQQQGTSSRVAAGLFNPITGNRMVKTWKADELFPFLHRFYRELESATNARFFHPMPIYRPFDSIEKQNTWMADSADPAFAPFLNADCDTSTYDAAIYNEFGGIEVKQSGYVDMVTMLDAYRNYLVSKDAFVGAEFDERELELFPDRVRWRNIEASKVIFCRGRADGQSHLFDWLPYRPVKGEVLTIQLEEGQLSNVVNRGCWILPQVSQNQVCRVGATYNWRDLSETPTEEGKNELLGRLNQLLRLPYRVTGHVAGVRPATSDRRPFIGIHPQEKQIGIFNGFGTKGVSLSPYFAMQFSECLATGQLPEPLVDIARFWKGKE